MKHLLQAALLLLAGAASLRAELIVVEGESFAPQDRKGWKVTHQDDSYGSHSYGGMWTSQGGLLGAAAASVGSVATRQITLKDGGKFRVWSKYQAPPYFNYLHKLEIHQGGKKVFEHVYGKAGTDRLWSFSGVSDELWWPWGVDHDAAEAPKQTANLAAGPAELRLITVANAKPAGDRFVDFIVLTTNLKGEYKGFKPYAVGSPFANEALDATKLYLRFVNTGAAPGQLTVSRAGHFQPQYGGATVKVPAKPVAAGTWSEWINIGPFCRLVHDEGLTLTLNGGKEFSVQFARDEAGKDLVGDLKMSGGETAVVPIDVTWNKKAVVKTSKQHALEIIAESKKWRKANGGKKPKEILYYGAFSGNEDWVHELKATLGYNTLLPAKYEQVKVAGLYAHAHNPKEIEAFAKTLKDKENFRVLSFGDEISLGKIDYKDPKLQQKFRAWLKAKKIGKAELGVESDQAVLTDTGSKRLAWYSNWFNEEARFAAYRDMTALAKQLIGPHVLTGANYSPHHGCLYYGPIYQWVDIFKHQGMTMHWSEDYLFSVPEPPQMISWMFATMRCATKYHNQPIHFYVMPHAPGQEPGFLRRNMVFAVGAGARHIDNFWVAPAERFTENYVNWHYRDTFRVLSESIYDSAEVEHLTSTGKVRSARVAIVLSKATDYNESRLMVDKAKDPFAARCKNAPEKINQTLCRKEQQLLYLALRHAQHAVDLITEEDIVEGYLKNLDVVYFAGEWLDHRCVPKLDEWVKGGGVLYCCAGLGLKNEFDEPQPEMLKLLGLKDVKTTKDAYHLRTLLELPLVKPVDRTFGPDFPQAIAMKQELTPVAAAEVTSTWSNKAAASTRHQHGEGVIRVIGGLPGTNAFFTVVKPVPWARGGRHMVYNPGPIAVNDSNDHSPAVCSRPGIEATVLDAKDGTLVTLVNWTNAPIKDLSVKVRVPFAPRSARSVSGQRELKASYADGVASFTLDLAEADYVILRK